MCGFAGYLNHGADENPEVLVHQVRRMAAQLAHRGPDGSGEWVDERHGVGLAHRRLAIVDLSPYGDQPMISPCGRYVLVFNGEIYNFQDLRQELDQTEGDREWRGHSDTEVLLAAICDWGLQRALETSTGMFALALWDRKTRELHLARDRVGEKPLYYGWSRGVFLFGSELKSLRAHPAWDCEIDRDAIALYLRYNCIPAPYSIYKGIRKLPPGTILRIFAGPNGRYLDESPREYWSARQVVKRGVFQPFSGDEKDAEEALDRLLSDVVRRQMFADVPLGAFLSGGIDSSTVVAVMQAQSSQPIRTFTIGFREAAYNEADAAGRVAAHLGTDHTELFVDPDDARDVIPHLPGLYDEPFSDSSQIPTFLISKLTRQHVKVCVSGDGGDEVFGGYNRYVWVPSLWRWLRPVPRIVRCEAARAIRYLSPGQWNSIFQAVRGSLPRWAEQTTPGYKLHRLADVLPASDPPAMYSTLISHWRDPVEVVREGQEPETLAQDPAAWPFDSSRVVEQMMFLDLVTYLPDDIMVKVDRASMGVGLEARAPYLDHSVIEFAWTLPVEMKIRDDKGKHILRRVLKRYVPDSLVNRPKAGFSMPIDDWLRGPLREWAEDLLDESRLQKEGYFRPAKVRGKWLEHLSGKRDWQYHIWDILMFQSWLAETGSA
jgi:asparagine synthase (glutamine-hydrolysing)